MKLLIKKEIYDKVMHWVNKVDYEVSGFGTVEYDKDKQLFTVTDAFLLKQTGGPAVTDIDDTSLAQLEYKVINERRGQLNWWWHSHVKMSTFWSGTDTDTIKKLGKNGWITATVFNQLYQMKSAVCYTTSSQFGTLLHINEDMPCSVDTPPIDPALIAAWDAEFTENVQEKKVVAAGIAGISTPSMYSGQQSFYDDQAYYADRDTEFWEKYGRTPSGKVRFTSYDKWGLAGYPVKDEAYALGLGVTEYVKMLNDNDLVKIYKLEEDLLSAVAAGKLKENK
jgi:hypothetical protein